MVTCRRKEPPPSGHAFNKEWDIAVSRLHQLCADRRWTSFVLTGPRSIAPPQMPAEVACSSISLPDVDLRAIMDETGAVSFLDDFGHLAKHDVVVGVIRSRGEPSGQRASAGEIVQRDSLGRAARVKDDLFPRMVWTGSWTRWGKIQAGGAPAAGLSARFGERGQLRWSQRRAAHCSCRCRTAMSVTGVGVGELPSRTTTACEPLRRAGACDASAWRTGTAPTRKLGRPGSGSIVVGAYALARGVGPMLGRTRRRETDLARYLL